LLNARRMSLPPAPSPSSDTRILTPKILILGTVTIILVAGLLIFRANFHFFSAKAALGDAPTGGYSAVIEAHMGQPVDATCIVDAIDEGGNAAGEAEFVLHQIDGKVVHSGELTYFHSGAVEVTIRCTHSP
jgi:hypothetical protein